MTRVDRYDKMLKRMFQKYIIYDMHNTTSCTHIPHYAHITVIPNHLHAQDFKTQQS